MFFFLLSLSRLRVFFYHSSYSSSPSSRHVPYVSSSPSSECMFLRIIVLIIIIIAHIYIGSLGMQGAFDAMNSGEVDRNWAKEHHGLWVEEDDQKAKDTGKDGIKQPAE